MAKINFGTLPFSLLKKHSKINPLLRKTLPFFLFNLIALSSLAQLELIDQKHDFGMLLRADDNWTDFEIRNSGTAEAVIFRVEGPRNTDIKLSAKTVKPGTSEYIRVAVSPKAAGKFKIDLKVFASAWQAPEMLRITGESSFAASSLIPCPDFDGNQAANDNQFHISVRNEVSNTPLENVVVRVYKDGRPVKTLTSNQYGEAELNLPYGRYFFSVGAESMQLDTALYVNAVNKHLLAMLNIRAPERIASPTVDEIARVEAEDIPNKTDRKSDTLPEIASVVSPADENAEPEREADENAVLPLSAFKENNLVFLVDVSSSMKQHGRLDLLKIAMVQLLDVLRPVDRFSLISYSDETKTLIETERNLDRQACIDAILALEAGGGTAGAKAINRAGSVAIRHFVEAGNNQIILATDGAFNDGNKKALRYAEKYEKKDVKLSVLGIKCGKFTTTQMTELVADGGGRYIPIRNAEDAGVQLIDEIKKSSAREMQLKGK